jgi:enoyl-CoA hydratase/carnithine racemase
MLAEAHRLLARLLVFPAYTVAAVNGHCFAAGAMLAAAHDARVMRADRGFWCLPEVDIGLPFSPGMAALLEARLPQPARHEAMVTGVRWGGEEAARRGVVDAAVPGDRVLPEAVERAERFAAQDRGVRQAIKRGLYAATERALLEERR